MQIDHVIDQKITLCQSIYLKKVLDYFKMIDSKPVSILMNLRVPNFIILYDKKADNETFLWYKLAI